MLKFMSELLLVLSIFIRFIILKGILTYKKEGSENKNIAFYILLSLIYITTKLFNVEEYYFNAINYLFDITVFVIWGIYYKYFYKIGYIKYIVCFYLFNIYYDLLKSIINRALFFVTTGYVISSKESLLVSYFDNMKIDIYTNLFIVVIYIYTYYLL